MVVAGDSRCVRWDSRWLGGGWVLQGSAHSSAQPLLLLGEPAAQLETGPEHVQISERFLQTFLEGWSD